MGAIFVPTFILNNEWLQKIFPADIVENSWDIYQAIFMFQGIFICFLCYNVFQIITMCSWLNPIDN